MSETRQSESDKALWVAIRRGALLVVSAIEHAKPDDQLWVAVKRGIGVVVSAIEIRYNLTARG